MAEEDWTIVPKVTNSQWQEEDEEDIKDNWDDEDEDEPSKSSSNADSTQQSQETSETKTQKLPVASTKKKNKALREKIMKKEENQRKTLTAEELLAEKLERQRIVEEGDLALAKETLGISSTSDSSVLNTIRLVSSDDFDEFRKALAGKLSPYVRSPHYLTFLENLFLSLASGLETDEIKKLNTTLNALYNEKIKLNKPNKGKKGKKTNAEIKMERDNDYSYDQYANEYEDFF